MSHRTYRTDYSEGYRATRAVCPITPRALANESAITAVPRSLGLTVATPPLCGGLRHSRLRPAPFPDVDGGAGRPRGAGLTVITIVDTRANAVARFSVIAQVCDEAVLSPAKASTPTSIASGPAALLYATS
jgi:hypothetical protein